MLRLVMCISEFCHPDRRTRGGHKGVCSVLCLAFVLGVIVCVFVYWIAGVEL